MCMGLFLEGHSVGGIVEIIPVDSNPISVRHSSPQPRAIGLFLEGGSADYSFKVQGR